MPRRGGRHRIDVRAARITPDPSANTDPLAKTVMRGGRQLMIRQIFGLLIGGGGGFVLLRLIGPNDYGTYAAAFEISFFAQTMAELNLDVYLVRRASMSRSTYHVVGSLLAVSAAVATLVLLAATPLLSGLLHTHHFTSVAAVMFLSLPLVHAQQVPLSFLERELRYTTISRIEMFAQLIVPVVAIPMALAGFGAWAAVAGWWAQQVLLLICLWWAAPLKMAWNFQRAAVHDALSFGVASTASTGAYATRNLVAPLLLGHLLGSAAIGYVSLIQRILDSLAVAKQVIYRMSIAVLAKVVDQRRRLLSAVADGMLVQGVTVGVPVAVFSCVAPWLVPWVFGPAWKPVIDVFPLVGISYLAWTVFSVESACLLTLRRPWTLVGINAANAGALWIGTALFVPHFGLRGYGYAELVSIASCGLMHVAFVRRFGEPRLTAALIWLVAAGATCAVSLWTPAALVLLLPPLLLSGPRQRLLHHVGLAFGGPFERRWSMAPATQ
jgi:O-antigen/teichoic acid export membrane protein